MASTSGTATSYIDLLTRLRTYVTVTVPVADRWVEERWDDAGPYELILRGPGSGADEIFVGIRTVSDLGADYQNWKLAGMTGFLSGQPFENQPGYSMDSPSPVHLPLWDSTIPYWFVVNGRRIIVVAKVSTRYMWCHLGFLNAYASPGQFPYPLLVGGAMAWGNNAPPASTSANWRWSYNGAELTNPSHSAQNTGFDPSGGWTGRSQMRLRLVSGAWRDFWAFIQDVNSQTQINDAHLNSGGSLTAWRNIGNVTSRPTIWPVLHNIDAMEAALDGSYALLPLVLCEGSLSGGGNDLFGELDGVFAVTGGPSAEDIITEGGVDHLVVPNVFRQNRGDFVAIRLA